MGTKKRVITCVVCGLKYEASSNNGCPSCYQQMAINRRK